MNKNNQSTDNNIREWLRKENVFDNDILKFLSEYGVVNAPYDLRTITKNKWDQLFRKCLAEKSKELKSQSTKNRFEKKLKKVEKLWKMERKKIGNNENENENETKQIEPIEPTKQQKQLTKSTANWNDEYAEQMVETQNQINKKYQQTVKEKKSKRVADENKSNNLRRWLQKEDAFDPFLLEILSEKYAIYNPPQDLGKISQKQWTKIFRNSMAQKAKDLKSQTAKNRFEKKLKKIEKVWRKQPKISKSKRLKKAKESNENEDENEDENKQIEPDQSNEPIKQKQLTKSTSNWNKEYAEQKVEMQNQIDNKYQQTVNQNKIKQITDENKSNNLRRWLQNENAFDPYLLEILSEQYGVYNPPQDLGKISQKQWTKIFRNSMAQKAKDLKSQTAKNRFEKKLKKIEKVWKKQPKISKRAKESNENKENGLIQSKSDVALSKTIIAKEWNENQPKKKKKKVKKIKYMDLSEKMNMFIAIETGNFKMLQTVQEYHIRNIFSTKKGSINGLHYCCQYERAKMLKFLLENNMKLVSKINAQNFLGNTAAFISVITMSEYENKWSDYSFDCLKMLCEWKGKYVTDLNMQNLKGRTLLMHTALHNQIQVMEYLLSLKNKDDSMRIDMEIQDKQKQTAIMYAVKHSHFESVMILCAYGARGDVKTLRGTNASDYASGKLKIFLDIQYCMDGLKMVRDSKMKQGVNIPMELIYIMIYYVCDIGDMEKVNQMKEKTKQKLEKQNNKGNGKKQKRKEIRHTGPQTGGDYQGWFG